ncbi:hypothetical protein K402DRAFT_420706 [Aulographum hederae CBS 113979]|uniref:Uncharacterized protein n=1 Tax=Aulographum hederae CBS 113979 TaxID=1176131 RepID=A0A6G1H1Z3_9PEZI|nr:hypothetical protein K402DRAFT_420706 [Aulographum hederae CBS 113979]
MPKPSWLLRFRERARGGVGSPPPGLPPSRGQEVLEISSQEEPGGARRGVWLELVGPGGISKDAADDGCGGLALQPRANTQQQKQHSQDETGVRNPRSTLPVGANAPPPGPSGWVESLAPVVVERVRQRDTGGEEEA